MDFKYSSILIAIYLSAFVMFSASPDTTQLENMVGLILVIVFIIEIILFRKKLELQWNYAFLFLILYLILSLALVLHYQDSFRRFITLLLCIVLFYITYSVGGRGFTMVSATLGVSIGLIILIYYNISDIILISQGLQNERLDAGFNANEFAYLLLMYIWLLINVYNYYKNKIKNNIYTKVLINIIILITSYLIIYTGSRKGVILLFLIMLYLISSMYRGLTISKKITLGVMLIFFGVLFFNWYKGTPFYYRTENILLIASGEYVKDGSVDERVGMFEIGINLWSQKPILGWGFDAYRYISGYGTYSHNNYIEVLVNTGIIGFLLYHSFYVSILYQMIKRNILDEDNKKKHIYKISIIGLVILLIWSFGAVSYTSKLTWIWIGFILSNIDSNVKNDSNNMIINVRLKKTQTQIT